MKLSRGGSSYDDDENDEGAEGELAGAGVEWVTQKLEAAAAALGKSTGLEQASRRARLEQRVEDYNALQKASGTFHRAVLVLPLTPEFDPPRGQPGHGRVQFSDRVSASASVGKELTRRALEVPWHFKLEPLARNDDEELVEELGFEEVRPTRRLGKDPLNRPLKARNGDALGSGIGVVPPLKRVFCSPPCGNQFHCARPSTQHCARDCVCSMVWRWAKVPQSPFSIT